MEQAKDYIKKSHKVKTLEGYISYFGDAESMEKGKKIFVTSERNSNKMRLKFNMNNTIFKLPLNQKKINEPLFSMYFNLVYTMDSENIYDDIIAYPSKKLLAQIYETKTSYMHIYLSQFELDMIYYIPYSKNFTRNIASERLVSNFRFSCSIESYIAPLSEVSTMNIDVNMEPIILAFGMRQLRKLIVLTNLSLDFLSKLEEKYIPFIKPQNVQNGIVIIQKKKLTMKQIIRRVLVTNQIKKVIKQKFKEVKKRKKRKIYLLIQIDSIHIWKYYVKMIK